MERAEAPIATFVVRVTASADGRLTGTVERVRTGERPVREPQCAGRDHPQRHGSREGVARVAPRCTRAKERGHVAVPAEERPAHIQPTTSLTGEGEGREGPWTMQSHGKGVGRTLERARRDGVTLSQLRSIFLAEALPWRPGR